MSIEKIKVLFLASNPIGTSTLSLDKELRLITRKIRSSEYRDAIDLIPCLATQADDLLDYLNQYRPDILHFSGHGSPDGEILLMDQDGSPMPVSPQALKQLLEDSKDKIRLVLLNACYTSGPTEAIQEVIDYAIGMTTGISDDAARSFAAQFYSSLAYGHDIPSAFDQAAANLSITNASEMNLPELKIRPGAPIFPATACVTNQENLLSADQSESQPAQPSEIGPGRTPPTGPVEFESQEEESSPIKEDVRKRLLSKRISLGLAVLAVALFAGGWLAARLLDRSTQPLLGVALTNLRYQAGGWDPGMVDIRTSASDGLLVNTGYSLLLSDLWVSVPDDLNSYLGQFEVFAKGEVIGRSELLELMPGGTNFESIYPTSFQHDRVENAWFMQPDWDNLDLALIIYNSQKQPIDGVVTHLALNKTGGAWYLTPPYAHLISIVYSVNNGPRLKLDFSTILENGLDVLEGDQLILYEIWYKSEDTDIENNLQVEAYPSSGNYDGSNNEVSVPMTFEEGINNLLQEPFTWERIPADCEWLIITLSRTDHTVLDRYIIPVGATKSPGLIPVPEQ